MNSPVWLLIGPTGVSAELLKEVRLSLRPPLLKP